MPAEQSGTPSAATTADRLEAVLTELAAVVAGIAEDQSSRPTPCTDLTVAELREHVLGWLTTFAAGFADPDGRTPRSNLDDYSAPADGAGTVRAARDQLVGAIRNGAAERPLQLAGSAMPGEMALGMVLWEYVVHGWDLAVATGQDWDPPAEAAAQALAFAPGMLTGDYQGPGKSFAPRVQVPDDAPILARLLGLSGRDPHWTA